MTAFTGGDQGKRDLPGSTEATPSAILIRRPVPRFCAPLEGALVLGGPRQIGLDIGDVARGES